MQNNNIFENERLKNIRRVMHEGKEWYVAVDAAKSFNYRNPQYAIKKHCKSAIKHSIPHPQNPLKQIDVYIIPEDDVRRLFDGADPDMLNDNHVEINNTIKIANSEFTVIREQEVLNKRFRMYGSIEKPYFLAQDVGEWIEYDTSSLNKMIANVDDDEKIKAPVLRSGQKREMLFFTEDGLYEVLMQRMGMYTLTLNNIILLIKEM